MDKNLTKPITVDNLGTSPIVLPTLGQDTTNYQSILAGATSIPQPTPYSDEAKSLIGRIQSLTGQTSGLAGEATSLQETPEYREKERLVQQYTDELNAIKAESESAQLGQEGRLASVGAISGAQRDIERNAAIRALTTGAKLQSAQDNLNLANQQIERAIKLKYKPLEAELATYKTQLESITPFLNAEQKKIADERALQIDLRSQDIKNLQSKQDTYAKVALENNQPELASKIASANSDSEINSLIGQIRPLKTGTSGDALANDFGSGEFSDVINSTSNLLGATKGAETKRNLITYLNNKDYVNAYSTIANSVEDSLTGTVKTKFADSRTDYQILSGFKKAIEDYANAGGDMGLLKGTEESIKRKLGIDSGKASELATQLWREFQVYRSNMTGAAFTPQESRDYASVNPTLSKSLDLNLSVINGALNQLENRITGTIKARVPNADKIFNLANPSKNEILQNSLEDEAREFEKITGNKVTGLSEQPKNQQQPTPKTKKTTSELLFGNQTTTPSVLEFKPISLNSFIK